MFHLIISILIATAIPLLANVR